MSDIRCIPVKDSIIADCRDVVDFGVISGASQNSYQRFPSTSSSNSALIFNVQVPSEDIIIDRALMLTTGLSLRIEIDQTKLPAGVTLPAPATSVFNYGVTDALAAFPLNSLFMTSSCTINNTSLSVNLQDVLPQLLKMNSVHSMTKYNSMTPALPDQYWANFASAVNTNSNPLAGLNNAGQDSRYKPRGCHPANISVLHTWTETVTAGGAVTNPSNTSLFPATAPAGSTKSNEKWVIILDTVVTEPLIGLNPWTFGEADYNNAGIYGVNNMSFTFTIDGGCKRVFSTANPYITNISLNSVAGIGNGFSTSSTVGLTGDQTRPALLMRFLATQPTDMLSTKNVLPMLQFPRYLTSNANNGTPLAAAFRDQATGVVTATRTKITSNSLQLSQVPDKFIICVRTPMVSQDWKNSSSYLTITGCQISFNNSQGLLSNASQQDLWRMTKKNGCNLGWEEFSGMANTQAANSGGNDKLFVNAYIPTLGSILVINPAYDLSLPSYITNGSIGQYLFQIQLDVVNQFNVPVVPEVCIITVNSGVMVTQQGTSACYSGLLTKELVLATSAEPATNHFTSNELNRKIGGNLDNSALSTMGGMVKHTHKRHGGAYSGGATSGGGNRLSKHI